MNLQTAIARSHLLRKTEGREMDTEWYYMAKGWIRKKKRVGPISETVLLSLIDAGKIQPSTLLQSSKTKGKWVPMETISAAMKRWRASHPEALEH